jgi:hypothetical protein
MGLSNPAQRLDAVDPGHHDIEEHGVRGGATFQQSEGTATILRRVDHVAPDFEQVNQIGADSFGVVDDENSAMGTALAL